MKAAVPTTEALVARCIARERQLDQRYYATVYRFLRRLGVRPAPGPAWSESDTRRRVHAANDVW